ncbi:MAG: response regulator [Candidatus Cloacimonadota bacterium]|nr:response regulator [Candidatus Cloacimonadota bacterium]
MNSDNNSSALDSDKLFKYDILLAEDNEINAEIGKEMLEIFNAKITIASNGNIAIYKTLQNKFDLIFMDINMPELDGLQATDEIRNNKKNINFETPIIALTAHINDSIIHECKNIGMDEVIQKPLKYNSIQNVLDQWINNIHDIPLQQKTNEKLDIPFDYDEALYEFGNNKEFLQQVINKFLILTEDQIQEIDFLMEENNLDAIKAIVHKIRGGSASLSMNILSQVAADIEDMCLDNQIQALKTSLPKFHNEFIRVKKFSKKVL